MDAATSNHRPAQIYTEEKAVHLVRVFIAVLSIMLLLGWQQIMLLNPMKHKKVEMEHMDPSEIVATPFPLANITSFTMFPVVISMIYWLVRSPSKFTSNLVSWTKLTLITFALFALCGDNMVKHWKHSILSALYIGTLASSTLNGIDTSNIIEELPFNDFSDILATMRLYGMLLFSIPFQVASVLDHGVQISRWPLPILFGVTYGYVIGTMLGLLVLSYSNSKKTKTGKKS